MAARPELRLFPRRARIVGLAAVCVAFSVTGVLMARDGRASGWFVLAFFGLGALAALVQLLPGASCLRLDAKGFTVRSLVRTTSFRWSEVGEFAPGRIGGNRTVVFSLAPESQRQRRLRRFNVVVAGAEGALPDTYGLSAERLADVLNEWRLGRGRPDA